MSDQRIPPGGLRVTLTPAAGETVPGWIIGNLHILWLHTLQVDEDMTLQRHDDGSVSVTIGPSGEGAG